MSDNQSQSLFREHIFEAVKTAGLVLLSVLFGIFSYVWNTTVDRLEAKIDYDRHTIEILYERVRIAEIAAAANQSLNVGFSQRLDRLEQMNYGFRTRSGEIK